MKYFKTTLLNTWEFLRDTKAYFRDVLLMHGLVLFILIPSLASTTRFILDKGTIRHLSTDNLWEIITEHPVVFGGLLTVLLLILLCLYCEFTFLLISMYFIKIRQPVPIRQLLRMTLIQIKKIRPATLLFFLGYFFLALPISGLSFNSDLLSKIKLPAFIVDFIFANRVSLIALTAVVFLVFLYLSIRVIFVLPELILRDASFKQALQESWHITKNQFWPILGRFLFIGASLLAASSLGFLVILTLQRLVEIHAAKYALTTAIAAMTLLQGILLLNVVLSSVGIFFIIVDYMADEGFLPPLPAWFYQEELLVQGHGRRIVKNILLGGATGIFLLGVVLYNSNFLADVQLSRPITISHRGVSSQNGVQNTLASLAKTAAYRPAYVEMDIQLTKDQQFVVFHDFNLKALTGVNKSPGQLTLTQLQQLAVKENGTQAQIASFDDYLAAAAALDQKLVVEIKTQQPNTEALVSLFLEKYRNKLAAAGHLVQSINFQLAEAVKQQAPELTVGYILPFNFIGPPATTVDFLTMEYSTINENFVTAAHDDGKQVFVWTVNDQTSVTRMMFYGVDGIITDDMALLNQTISTDISDFNYSDQLAYFVIGIG